MPNNGDQITRYIFNVSEHVTLLELAPPGRTRGMPILGKRQHPVACLKKSLVKDKDGAKSLGAILFKGGEMNRDRWRARKGDFPTPPKRMEQPILI